jgi:hypothetical protein
LLRSKPARRNAWRVFALHQIEYVGGIFHPRDGPVGEKQFIPASSPEVRQDGIK